MDDLAIFRLLSLPLESVFLFISLNMLRPLGLAFGFIAFAWGMGQSVVTRAGIAIALALPIMVLVAPDFAELRAEASRIEIPLLLIKEFAVGYGLGILASLPFLAMQFAGAITDSYRGENSGGLSDPAGGELPTFGLLFMMIGLYAFFASGGLWHLVAGLYRSYRIWPTVQPLPDFAPDAWRVSASLVDALLRDALVIAAPLLAILIVIDFALAVAGRLAQKFQITQHDFTLKNLAAILSLPILALYVDRVSEGSLADALRALPIFRDLLR